MKRFRHAFRFSVIFFLFAFLLFFVSFKIHSHKNFDGLLESGKVLEAGEDFLIIKGKRGIEFTVLIDNSTDFIRGRHLSGDYPEVGEMVVVSGYLNDDREFRASSVYVLRS